MGGGRIFNGQFMIQNLNFSGTVQEHYHSYKFYTFIKLRPCFNSLEVTFN
jgi:hypothetical protein